MKKICITLILLFQGLYSFEADLAEIQVDIGYAFGRYINIKDYASIGAYTCIDLKEPYSSFLDVRGFRFNNGKWAYSTGMGLRYQFTDENMIGVNGYYDYRRGKTRGNFHQLGLGVEWEGCLLEARLNGYFPISNRVHQGNCDRCDLGDGYVITHRKCEYANTGFDAEIGINVYTDCDFNIYSAAGPYYYSRSHNNCFWGGFSRLEIDWHDFLSIELIYSYDQRHCSNVQGIVKFTIPLDFFCNTGLFSMCDSCEDVSKSPHRNGIIVTDHCDRWSWNWD